MSRTWELRVNGLRSTEARLTECGLTLELGVECDFGSLACELSDSSVREIYDWLTWYLDEGPEPGVSA